MTTWDVPSSLRSMMRKTLITPDDTSKPAVVSDFGTAIFTSPGSVDSNTVTRIQRSIVGYSASLTGVSAEVNFTFTNTDFSYLGANEAYTASMFIAPASSFTGTPTPAQILAANPAVYRASNSHRSGAGKIAFTLIGTPASQLNPNTKYWVLVAPTKIVQGSTPSVGNDSFFAAEATSAPGDPNTVGRALSFWTNRTPNAPVITSPASNTDVNANAVVNLSITVSDPDAVTGSLTDVFTPARFRDVVGVQIQYAPQPSPENPSPVWQDLPVSTTSGTLALQPGWYFEDPDRPASNARGAKLLRENLTIPVKCGNDTLVPGHGFLPSGSWQIRVRTFNYGHPFANDYIFGSRVYDGVGAATYPTEPTPTTYPSNLASPWSNPVTLTVYAQVPSPTAIAPSEGRAVSENSPVGFSWRYLNTAVPPFAQKSREVQIRKVGAPDWTVLVSGNSASSTYLYDGSGLEATTEYEWRVRVTDVDDKQSTFSVPARFWVVPIPDSGAVIPVPSDTIDGATLGCGTHRVVIYRRGGMARVGEITGITKVSWGRTRDDISVSKIEIAKWDIDCGNLLARLRTWAYEIVIFRNNGFSEDRVWEGPITLLTYETDKVTIQAKDVMAYLYRRIIRQRMYDPGNTVVNRAAQIVRNCLALDDPNVLQYLRVLGREDDAKQYRSTPSYSRTGFEEIDDMAANAGLDYTALGRSILLWGTRHRIGTLPEFGDEDLGNSPIVSEYGMSLANRYVVSDGNGVWGEANRLDAQGKDEVYGLVEMLSSTWASDSTADSGTYTQEGLQKVRESFAAMSERSIADRYPSPIVVRLPDNTRLNPNAVISIQHLVPGVVIPLRSVSTLRSVVASQKLDSVSVTEENGEEIINITLSPFSRDDADTGGEIE